MSNTGQGRHHGHRPVECGKEGKMVELKGGRIRVPMPRDKSKNQCLCFQPKNDTTLQSFTILKVISSRFAQLTRVHNSQEYTTHKSTQLTEYTTHKSTQLTRLHNSQDYTTHKTTQLTRVHNSQEYLMITTTIKYERVTKVQHFQAFMHRERWKYCLWTKLAGLLSESQIFWVFISWEIKNALAHNKGWTVAPRHKS